MPKSSSASWRRIFRPALFADLKSFLGDARFPLAVRSSSLLEDSQYQPFTGVYETFMLANQHADDSLRLAQLTDAIKLVYASTFSRHAKAYVRATPFPAGRRKNGGNSPASSGRVPRCRGFIRIFRESRVRATFIRSRR